MEWHSSTYVREDGIGELLSPGRPEQTPNSRSSPSVQALPSSATPPRTPPDFEKALEEKRIPTWSSAQSWIRLRPLRDLIVLLGKGCIVTEAAGQTTPEPGETGSRFGGPPNLLMTLLGDYWLGRTELLPSAAIVDLLAVFGVTGMSARAALSRMVKRDLLHSEKSGRNTFYGLTDRCRAVLEEGGAKLFGFGIDQPDWDGLWSMVAFSVPEAKRSRRGSIRTKLRWQGFAPLYDGLWISPHDSLAEALAACHALGIEVATGIRGQIVDNGNPAGSALRAWDLASVASDYRAFEGDACHLSELAKAGRLSDAEALVKRTSLMGEWRIFITRDPQLPTQLLPHDWPMQDARQAFLAAYNALEGAARRCVRDIVAAHNPETARIVFGTAG